MISSMNVLVTGGAGYIGSVVSTELLRAGHRVTILDSLIKGHRKAVPKDAELVVGDVYDRPLVERVLADAQVSAVMHFAAFIEAGESMKTPETFFRNNTANALSLLEAMIARGVHLPGAWMRFPPSAGHAPSAERETTILIRNGHLGGRR